MISLIQEFGKYEDFQRFFGNGMNLQTHHSWIEQDEGLLLIISSNQLDEV